MTEETAERKVILDWKPEKDGIFFRQELKFFSDENVDVQILFIGGGNGYVLYRTGILCEEVNRKMSKKILENTYSLQLAIAVVGITENYETDYKALRQEMDHVKENMPVSRTIGALPIVETDFITGFPMIQQNEIYNKDNRPEKLSKESYLKRKKVKAIMDAEQEKAKKEGKHIEREFDELVTERGEDSMLAIVHIDGNDMGKRIGDLLGKQNKSYEQAIDTMREISWRINTAFKEKAYGNVEKDLKSWLLKNGYEKEKKDSSIPYKKDGTYLRKIIVAGDDVTFVCNARMALALVKQFCKYASNEVMYVKRGKKEVKKYGFTVCAGIAYINSHFPFHIGYQVAEACCESAKKQAKGTAALSGGKIGNWVDFQIVRNAQMENLEKERDKNYKSNDGMLIQRPYYIPMGTEPFKRLDDANREAGLRKLEEKLEIIKKLPKSKAMQLRNTYPLGIEETEALVSYLNSREQVSGKKKPVELKKPFQNGTAVYYDALELWDLYDDIKWEGGK